MPFTRLVTWLITWLITWSSPGCPYVMTIG
jgi:hypothetical protein